MRSPQHDVVAVPDEARVNEQLKISFSVLCLSKHAFLPRATLGFGVTFSVGDERTSFDLPQSEEIRYIHVCSLSDLQSECLAFIAPRRSGLESQENMYIERDGFGTHL